MNISSTTEQFTVIIESCCVFQGTIYVTKAVCRELIEAKLPGSIVNISSMGVRGGTLGAIYDGTKGAVKSFGKGIAREFGK